MPGSQHPGRVPAQTTVLTLPAEIDITHARRLCGQFGAALVSGATVVVADMTATTFCDSSGARIMVLAWEQAAVNDIELRLVVPSAAVRRGFALMGLDGFLPFYPSLSAALTPQAAHASAARPWLGRS
jgi:anti-sigma B factor antagonist